MAFFIFAAIKNIYQLGTSLKEANVPLNYSK